jgi:chromosomal replication initiator protein
LELHAEPQLFAAWPDICSELRRAVGDETYEIWFAGLRVRDWDGQLLVIEGPSSTQAWVQKRFRGILENSARTILGSRARVQLASELGGRATSRESRSPGAGSTDPVSTLNPRYSFDQFVIGDGNRLAHGAALAVAENPGQAYNPLFIYAPPGLGKTHLLHAIGNYVVAFGGGATVRYATVEGFTNHFIAALSSRSLERFKQAYRDADVLLIDDVQFLASKAKTEEEFFHTFNTLYEAGRQLVFTCDRLPRQLVAVEERLRERFEAGLVAEMGPPDFATRVAILRKRAALDRVKLTDPAVLDLIAERVTDNVRALEGALIRIVAHHSLSGRPLDLAPAGDVVDQMYPARRSDNPSLQGIQTAVAAAYRISVAELISSSRATRVAWPRQLAIHLARELTTTSLTSIGDAFGGRNHATVVHACKRVSDRLRSDPDVQEEIDNLRASISSGEGDRSC